MMGYRGDHWTTLRLFTEGGSFSGGREKGATVPSQLANFSVLSADYFSAPEKEINSIEAF
jgi:predicted amidohydrolase YtcJ